MIDPQDLLLFLTSTLLLSLAPGPDNLFVLAQSMTHGARAGVLITLGLCTGLLVHTSAVALGVAALLQRPPLAFTLLKSAGAAYLLYLAWLAFRAGGHAAAPGGEALSGARLYRRGILMNLGNPKVSLFFIAFLPQFADPANGPLAPQLLLLGALFIVAALVVFGAISLLAGGIGRRLRQSPGIERLLSRLTGVLFVLLALKLLT
ncbi:MAG: LysE family translocator [Candidatus Sedimenticola endophacoides]